MKPVERIQVNGYWYKLEDDNTYDFDITETEGMTLETNTSCFEMSILKSNNFPSITYTNKRKEKWEEEFWDNESWMRGVLENNEESLKDIEHLTKEDLSALKYLLSKAQEKEWI